MAARVHIGPLDIRVIPPFGFLWKISPAGFIGPSSYSAARFSAMTPSVTFAHALAATQAVALTATWTFAFAPVFAHGDGHLGAFQRLQSSLQGLGIGHLLHQLFQFLGRLG